jgi:hypothetical protein
MAYLTEAHYKNAYVMRPDKADKQDGAVQADKQDNLDPPDA